MNALKGSNRRVLALPQRRQTAKERTARTVGDVVLTGIAIFAVMGLGSTREATAQSRGGKTPAAATAAAPAPVRSAGGGFTYDAAGRRDPFVSLATKGSDPRSEGRARYQGLGAVPVGEVTVKGIVLYERQLVAMVQAPDNRTYIVRPNDRLLDGTVRAVTAEAVVFVQQVNDPLSLVKQREIRKLLRNVEEGK
jgi:Tfp pilus assembly protein PilP